MGFLKFVEQFFAAKKVEEPFVVKYDCKHHPPITDINVAKEEIKTIDDAKTQFMKLVKCECVGKSRIDGNYIYKIARAEVIPQGVRDIFEIAIVVQMADTINAMNMMPSSYDENYFHIKVSTKFPLHEVKDKVEKLNFHKNTWAPPASETRGQIHRTQEQQNDYANYIAACLEKSKTQDVVISRREIPYESRPLGTSDYYNNFIGSYGNLQRLNE